MTCHQGSAGILVCIRATRWRNRFGCATMPDSHSFKSVLKNERADCSALPSRGRQTLTELLLVAPAQVAEAEHAQTEEAERGAAIRNRRSRVVEHPVREPAAGAGGAAAGAEGRGD